MSFFSMSHIKLTVKDWLLVTVFFLLVVSIVVNLVQYGYTSKASTEIALKENVIKTTISDLKKRTDSAGAEHVVFNPNENVLTKNLAKYSKRLDTVAALAGIEKKNDVTDYTRVSLTVSDKNLPAKIKTDTNQRRSAIYRDKTFDLRYNFPFGTDSVGTFDPAANIDIDYTNYRKRDWFLAGLKSYTDIYSPDKRVKIRGVERLVIEQPEPAFGLRLRGSASFNTYTKGFSAGPEAAFDFGRKQIRTNYYYNPAVNRWTWTFSLSYDIVRF